MLKNVLLSFPWHIMKKNFSTLVIMLFDLLFHRNYKILPSAVKLCVVTEYARWIKQRLRHIKSHSNSLTRGSVEQFNAEIIFSRYSDVVLPDGESIYPRAKDSAFYSMYDFPDKDTKLSEW